MIKLKHPKFNRDFEVDDVIRMMCFICDAMKRLEKAIQTDDLQDRQMYLNEVKQLRDRVEKNILG